MGAGHLTKKLFLKLNKASGSVLSEETDPDIILKKDKTTIRIGSYIRTDPDSCFVFF